MRNIAFNLFFAFALLASCSPPVIPARAPATSAVKSATVPPGQTNNSTQKNTTATQAVQHFPNGTTGQPIAPTANSVLPASSNNGQLVATLITSGASTLAKLLGSAGSSSNATGKTPQAAAGQCPGQLIDLLNDDAKCISAAACSSQSGTSSGGNCTCSGSKSLNDYLADTASCISPSDCTSNQGAVDGANCNADSSVVKTPETSSSGSDPASCQTAAVTAAQEEGSANGATDGENCSAARTSAPTDLSNTPIVLPDQCSDQDAFLNTFTANYMSSYTPNFQSSRQQHPECSGSGSANCSTSIDNNYDCERAGGTWDTSADTSCTCNTTISGGGLGSALRSGVRKVPTARH